MLDLTDPSFDAQSRLKIAMQNRSFMSLQNSTCGTPNKTLPQQYTFGQAVVYEVCKVLSHASNTNRGLVVLHSAGAGKTCAAVAAMDAFVGAKRAFFYVTTVAGLRANPPTTFDACVRPNQKTRRPPLTSLSFAQFAHILMSPNTKQNVKFARMLTRSVVILDEVHNLFHPLPNQKKEHEVVIRFLTQLNADRDFDMKLIIMTATLGDNPAEMVELLNIVRSRDRPLITVPNYTDAASVMLFARSILGLISYVDLANDQSIFPQVVKSELVEAEMGREQFVKYAEQLRKGRDASMDEHDDRVGKYMIGARKYANSLFTYGPDNELHEFSSKLPLLMERILAKPEEKHYVYSAFYGSQGYGGHGVMAIAKVLREQYGYEQLTARQAMHMSKSSALPASNVKRFVIMTPGEIRGDSSSERLEQQRTDAIKRIFNADENARGELVHVMLASQNYNEGVDLRAVRHVHFLEPLINYSMEKQAIGRAVRHCSHAQLRKEHGEWTVTVHHYLSTVPKRINMSIVNIDSIKNKIDTLRKQMSFTQNADDLEAQRNELRQLNAQLVQVQASMNATYETIDHLIYKEARAKYRAMEVMQLAVASAALDCPLMRDFHGLKVPCFTPHSIVSG